MLMTRTGGILLHPTSLPGPYGIGDLGPQALAFLGELARAGQGLWQVLPLGPTGYGDSPYAPFSSFAGNDLLLSPDLLLKEGLLEASDLRNPPAFDPRRVDYGALIEWKRPLLDKAAAAFLARAKPGRRAAFEAYRRTEGPWLGDYALFMAIKADYDVRARKAGVAGARWNNYWPAALALREPGALAREALARADEIARLEVLQFLFAEEWAALRAEARRLGIRIVGDLPIFVAEDSCDVWTRRELFRLDASGSPLEVAGVPPDYFSEDGQLWGNPLYDWKAHEAEGFAWWRRRLGAALARCDVVRVDHFRGFAACWSVPAGEKTARRGAWKAAPGPALLAALAADYGQPGGGAGGLPVVAEDLGFITPEVRKLRNDFGLPGMRVLQFAFDAAESGTAFDPTNGFLPHNYVQDCVVYTGTHDNDTLAGWLAGASGAERAYLDTYLGCPREAGPWALVREAWKSVAAWALAPMQDILGLGSEARMNTPSTLGGNWTWRMAPGSFGPEVQARLLALSRLYGRKA